MGLEGTPGIVVTGGRLGSEGSGRSGGSEGMAGKLRRRRAAPVPSSERAMTMSEIIKNLELDMIASNLVECEE